MSTFFIKSILSLVLLTATAVGMFTMFELFGRDGKRFNAETLRKVHRAAGIVYVIIFALISYLCLRFVFITKTELSVRGAFHGVLALAVPVLLGVKVLYVRIYRQFYGQAKTFGLVISIITFVMVAISSGYYLLVSEFGADTSYDRIIQYKEKIAREKKEEAGRPAVRTDPESISRGKTIFEARCGFCHNAYSPETIVGPGLKGILRSPELPVSRRPATPENIRKQLRQPFSRMPSFDFLSDGEAEDIIAFLNTL
ncbi:MAG: hypothetical protein C4526_06860 [Nitrospiraceae bacterium]|nr:MAG: hypothetical protein C4526_06860 [Nitrospiraceae bacterium]